MEVWVFNGNNSKFPSGVFSTMELAEAWIQKYGLSGTLTKYPIDEGVYDWALAKGTFKIKREDHTQAKFIQSFSSAFQEHYHFEEGINRT